MTASGTGAGTGRDVLRVRDLSTRFFTEEGQVNAVESVSFDVRENEILGIVGESGSGKSVTALSLIDLIESPGRVTAGEVWYRNPSLADEFTDSRPEAVDGPSVPGDVRSERNRRLRMLSSKKEHAHYAAHLGEVLWVSGNTSGATGAGGC